jgi:hypothetical protein
LERAAGYLTIPGLDQPCGASSLSAVTSYECCVAVSSFMICAGM